MANRDLRKLLHIVNQLSTSPQGMTLNQAKAQIHLERLSRMGYDFKFVNNKGQNRFHEFAASRNLDAAKLLISRIEGDTEMINALDNQGDPPLHVVLRSTFKGAPMADLLLSNGAKVDAIGGQEECSVLQYAVAQFDNAVPLDLLEILDVLKKHGANFNSVDVNGYSPLGLAIYYFKSEAILQKLIDLGADLKFVNDKREKQTLLQLAASVRNMEAAVLLLSLGADVNEVDGEGSDVLFYSFAITNHKIEDWYNMTKFLLEKGAKGDSKNNFGNTLLHLICFSQLSMSYKKVLKLLEEYGADFNALNVGEKTPIMYAIDSGKDIKFIECLISHGANPKFVCGYYHRSLLHQATVSSNLELATYLISKGCDVNALDKDLETPFHCLFEKPKDNVYEITKLLLDNGADPNLKNVKGRTVLDYATGCANSKMESRVIELLTSRGARGDSDGLEGVTFFSRLVL